MPLPPLALHPVADLPDPHRRERPRARLRHQLREQPARDRRAAAGRPPERAGRDQELGLRAVVHRQLVRGVDEDPARGRRQSGQDPLPEPAQAHREVHRPGALGAQRLQEDREPIGRRQQLRHLRVRQQPRPLSLAVRQQIARLVVGQRPDQVPADPVDEALHGVGLLLQIQDELRRARQHHHLRPAELPQQLVDLRRRPRPPHLGLVEQQHRRRRRGERLQLRVPAVRQREVHARDPLRQRRAPHAVQERRLPAPAQADHELRLAREDLRDHVVVVPVIVGVVLDRRVDDERAHQRLPPLRHQSMKIGSNVIARRGPTVMPALRSASA